MTPKIAESPKKRKPARGVIRTRRWTDKSGNAHATWQADFGTVNGKRLMRSYDTKGGAETWLHEQRLILEDQGHAAFALTDTQRMDAVKALDVSAVKGLPHNSPLETVARTFSECWTMLNAKGRTLREAADFMLKHAPDTGKQSTVSEAADAFTQDAKDNNLRPASIESIERRLRSLTGRYGDRPVSEITKTDADNWLRTISAKSRGHFRVIANGLFNYCIDHGLYVADNPFAAKRLRRGFKRDEVLPVCMPWRNVEALMQAAVEHESTMVPALAVGFFAGLRTNEVTQLDWADVDLEARRITVKAIVAKKRRTRYATIEDNLLAWLSPHAKKAGFVAPQGEKWRSRLDTIKDKAKVSWPHNAMRHSFASHHLARSGDPSKTAFQLGHHRDTSMLFEHYRALVTPEDGAKYFNIRPTVDASGVIQFKKTA